jgi:LPXTG-site transpeptidase (sortase) family protein
MTPDPTFRPASRAPRRSARLIAGLAVVLVTAACGSSDGDDVTIVGPTAGPTSTATASPDQTETSPEPMVQAESIADGIEGPYTLRIPRIGVDARVVPVASNKDRVLEPPRDPSVAGWWSGGAAPGERKGSAVLVGHSVHNEGGGVFDDIGDLSRGDDIEVDGSNGMLTYRVQSVDVLSKEEVARNAEKIFGQTGTGRLVVITCDDWDGKVWRSNVVTIAAPVG